MRDLTSTPHHPPKTARRETSSLTLNGGALILRRGRERGIGITGRRSVDLRELGVEGFEIEETASDSLIVAEEKEIKASNGTNHDIEAEAPKPQIFAHGGLFSVPLPYWESAQKIIRPEWLVLQLLVRTVFQVRMSPD